MRNTQPDWESRWENVQELITFASEVMADDIGAQIPSLTNPPLLASKKLSHKGKEKEVIEIDLDSEEDSPDATNTANRYIHLQITYLLY